MALDIIGPQTHLSDDSSDYRMLEFAYHLSEPLPLLNNLLERFYDDTIFYNQQVTILKNELLLVKEHYLSKITPQLIKKRKIYAKDPTTFSGILNRLLLEDPLYQFILQFTAICDEALHKNSEIRCLGD